MNPNILKYPSTELFQLSGFVRDFQDSQFLNLASELLESIVDIEEKILCGLQVGIPQKVLAFIDNNGQKILMVNPSIFSHSLKQTTMESCITFGNLTVEVERFDNIKIMYQDINGHQCFYEASSIDSVKLQRTINMMHGELLVDKLSKKQKNEYDKNLSFDSLQVCQTTTHRGKIIFLIRTLLAIEVSILFTKNLFDFSFELSLHNASLTALGFILLFVYAFYAKYETAKYKNCTSCQGANMIGNFVGYGFGFVVLFFLLKFV